MADIFLIANDPLLLHYLQPLVRRFQDEGYRVTASEHETRAGAPSGDLIREIIVVIGTVTFSKEYDRIKRWFSEWFTDLPRPKDGASRPELWVRVEDENRGTLARFQLRVETDETGEQPRQQALPAQRFEIEAIGTDDPDVLGYYWHLVRWDSSTERSSGPLESSEGEFATADAAANDVRRRKREDERLGLLRIHFLNENRPDES